MGASSLILVTGAAGALGSAVARRFLSVGKKVIGVDLKKASNSNIEWMEMDLANPKSVENGIAAIETQHGPIHSLVHCAGGFRFASIDSTTDADLEFLLNANLLSSIYLARALVPRMKVRHEGRLVFVSARATLQAPAGMAAYCATKAGINKLVESLAEEVKASGINVNAVLPTIIDTPANRAAMPEAHFSDWVPIDDLAEILFWLTEPASRSIHGALLPVAGRV